MSRVVVFTFAGRRSYLEVQRPFIARLMASFENLEFHLWDFSRNGSDHRYLRELAASSRRIHLFDQFYEGENPVTQCVKQVGVICSCDKCRVGKWSEAYKHYAANPDHESDVFVKLDDDIVFIETARFPLMLTAIRETSGTIVSAKVINNGLCALTEPGLRDAVLQRGLVTQPNSADAWWRLCTSVTYMDLAHEYFFQHGDSLLQQDPQLIGLPRARFSINTIGFDWSTVRQIAGCLDAEPAINDEHVISHNFDIRVLQGFLTAHLHYSDQRSSLWDWRESQLLAAYTHRSAEYLEMDQPARLAAMD